MSNLLKWLYTIIRITLENKYTITIIKQQQRPPNKQKTTAYKTTIKSKTTIKVKSFKPSEYSGSQPVMAEVGEVGGVQRSLLKSCRKVQFQT